MQKYSNVSFLLDFNEIDSINAHTVPYQKLEFKSQLNIPFTHRYYSRFDRAMNLPGSNSHTAAKPYVYEEVSSYYDFEAQQAALAKDRTSWWGRKLWNEHLVEVQGENYWFLFDPIDIIIKFESNKFVIVF